MNKKVNLTVTNMVVILALLAALVGVSWQQVGAQRPSPPTETPSTTPGGDDGGWGDR